MILLIEMRELYQCMLSKDAEVCCEGITGILEVKCPYTARNNQAFILHLIALLRNP